ncbi:MAG: hypothetical protein ACR2N1_02985 [Rubripirellula sp.]
MPHREKVSTGKRCQVPFLLEVESPSFAGVLHDNLSNKKRQGCGLTPLGEKYLGFKGNAFSSQDATGCRNTMALD